MKKILLAMMAVAAIGFTACGNKTQQGEAVDSTEIAINNANEEADASIAALSEQIEANDANKLQDALATVKEKIAELIKNDPKAAETYIAKVQDFLKENADKVKAIVGDNAAVAAAVTAITDVEPQNIVGNLLNQVGDATVEAKDAAVDAVNEKVEEGKAAVEEKANEVKEAAKEKANNAINDAANAAKKGLGL